MFSPDHLPSRQVGAALRRDGSLAQPQASRGIKPLLRHGHDFLSVCCPSSALRRPSSAFTLLELLAVIGVIAVLTGIVIGVGRYALENGRTSRARAELAILAAALDNYRAAQGDYPRTNVPAHLLQSLIGKRGPAYDAINAPTLLELTKFSTAENLDPFVNEQAILVDPWGRPYRYAYKSQAPWSNSSYVLYSAGPDGLDNAVLQGGGFPDVAALGNADNLYANR